MGMVLTLASPAPEALALARTALAGLPAPERIETLEPGRVEDWFYPHEAPQAAALHARLGPVPADYAWQPPEGRLRRLLVADMDSTIIACEGIDELADLAGVKPQVAEITERAMRGELPFEAALEARVALLAGIRRDAAELIVRERARLNPGARTLVQTMRAHGSRCVLLSGGFTLFAAPTAAAAGFDAYAANLLEEREGAFTGRLAGAILGREAKRARLLEECAALGVTPAEAAAVGDGANDCAMIQTAGLGCAYYAKPVLAEVAKAHIRHGGLESLLWFQGLPRSAWRVSAD